MADDPEIFEDVMARPPAEREAAVRSACGDDERRADRLVELVRIATAAELDTAELDAPYLPKGATFGRYCVVNLLGEGSFGQVYDALDLELDRRVALKVLHEERAGSEADDRRFQREAKVLARIDHPNVVRVYDAGVEGERRFLAMELVVGPSLREWMRPDRGWSAVLERLLPAARGLAAAHAAGIVHRDFKPENVLIDEARDRVVVADFGIARGHATAEFEPAEPAGSGPSPDAFTTESVIGTPAYMAPEQVFGEASPLSDQFAFCRVMQEALGGSIRSRPLPTSSDDAQGPDPLAHRRIPRALRRALERGTRLEPQERFADMDALVDALSAVQRNRRWTLMSVLVLVAALPVTYALTRPETPACGVWNVAEAAEALSPHWTALEAASLSTSASAVRAQLRDDTDDGLRRWASARTENCMQRVAGIVEAETAEARDQCFARWRERVERRVRWSAEHPDALESPRFVALEVDAPEGCAYVSPIGATETPLDPEVRAALEASTRRRAFGSRAATRRAGPRPTVPWPRLAGRATRRTPPTRCCRWGSSPPVRARRSARRASCSRASRSPSGRAGTTWCSQWSFALPRPCCSVAAGTPAALRRCWCWPAPSWRGWESARPWTQSCRCSKGTSRSVRGTMSGRCRSIWRRPGASMGSAARGRWGLPRRVSTRPRCSPCVGVMRRRRSWRTGRTPRGSRRSGARSIRCWWTCACGRCRFTSVRRRLKAPAVAMQTSKRQGCISPLGSTRRFVCMVSDRIRLRGR